VLWCCVVRRIAAAAHFLALAMKNFFKKKPDPIEQAKEWKQSVRKEMRQLERDIKSLEREEDKVVRQIKVLSKEVGWHQSFSASSWPSGAPWIC
jgi:septal ring factor EnvC (AmiA/AmiB activator)